MTGAALAEASPEAATRPGEPQQGRVLIIGCGALARELREVAALNRGAHMTVECLPAKLHNRPEKIAPAVRQRVQAAKANGTYRTILVGYMDCGTGGLLDRVCIQEGVQRLPGNHCYELYSGSDCFAGLQDAEPGTFYLTDYLVRHFDRLIMQGLGIADHPQLLEMYFGNYTRVIHLAQTEDAALAQAARRAAARLGLRCERIFTGIDGLNRQVVRLTEPNRQRPADARDHRRAAAGPVPPGAA